MNFSCNLDSYRSLKSRKEEIKTSGKMSVRPIRGFPGPILEPRMPATSSWLLWILIDFPLRLLDPYDLPVLCPPYTRILQLLFRNPECPLRLLDSYRSLLISPCVFLIPIDPCYDFPLLCPPYGRISSSYFRSRNARYVLQIPIDPYWFPLASSCLL